MDKEVFSKTLLQFVIKEAFCSLKFDSFSPSCRDGPPTRTAILQDFGWWIADVKCPSRFVWVTGPTAVGKTSIVCDAAFDSMRKEHFAADFFFRRMPGVGRELKGFSATIAYRLALGFLEPGRAIAKTLEDNPGILHASEEDQWHSLVIEPLKSVTAYPSFRPLFVIDGLDACRSHPEQSWVLRKLFQLCRMFPVAVILSSRPEEHIRREVSLLQQKEPSLFRANLELGDDESAQEDIRSLLNFVKPAPNEFTGRLLETWDALVSRILKDTAGQFFYVALALAYNSTRGATLEVIYNQLCNSSELQASVFAPLDELYDDIMRDGFSQMTDHQISSIRTIFYHLLYVQHSDSLNNIASFWGKRRADLLSVLCHFPSILRIPLSNSMSLSFHHPSFASFLSSPLRGGRNHEYHISKEPLLIEVFERSVQFSRSRFTWNDNLSRNLCSLWLSLGPEITVPHSDRSNRIRLINSLNEFDFWFWMNTYFFPYAHANHHLAPYPIFLQWLQQLDEGSILMKFPPRTPQDFQKYLERGFIISFCMTALSTLTWVTSMPVIELLMVPSHVALRLIVLSIPYGRRLVSYVWW